MDESSRSDRRLFRSSYTPMKVSTEACTQEEVTSEDELDENLARVFRSLCMIGHRVPHDIFEDLDQIQECVEQIGLEEMDSLVHKEFVLFPYKGSDRLLSGTLLHYAIKRSLHTFQDTEDFSGQNLVSYVLEANAAIDAKASYTNGRDADGKEKPRTYLEAIHLAAGLGNVSALVALDGHATKYNIETTELVNRKTTRGGEKYYAPIHEAAFAGKVDAVKWLLENKARPNETNSDGYTALHWLVRNSFEKEYDLEGVVHALVHAKAMLDAKTSVSGDHQMARGKSPLEMAVLPGSRFPRHLLVHLSPALNSSSPDHCFLEDLCVVALVNRHAAAEVVQSVAKNKDFRPKVRASSQEKGGTLLLSYLIHSSPLAAADFLELLWVKPKEEDEGHHPIPTQASLWGLRQDIDMRVTYQPDYKLIEEDGNHIMWPLYKYSAHNRTHPEWHSYLFKGSDAETFHKDHMYDVDTHALLFPNVLDIQILMSLTTLRRGDKVLFHRLPIQACISTAWRLQVKKQYLISTFIFGIGELLTLLNWGFIGVQVICPESQWICVQSTSKIQYAPISWAIVLAGALRDAVNVTWWFFAHSKSRKDAAVGLTNILKFGSKNITLSRQWSYRKFFLKTGALAKLGFVVLKFVFLFQLNDFGGQSVDHIQVWLCLGTIIQCWCLIYQLRVVISGFNMVIIFIHTFFSGIMVEMLALALTVYMSFAAAFVMLKREVSLTMAGLNLYRSLIMADGDSFSQVGLDTVEKEPILTVIMILATLMFNIVMLNLIIAIYTSEYSHLEKDAVSLFFQERAWIICQGILEHNKLPMWLATSPRARMCLGFTVFLCLAIPFCALIPTLWVVHRVDATPITGAAFSLAFGQVLWQALLTQGFWSTNMKLESREQQTMFLWTCHNADLRAHRMTHLSFSPASLKERFGSLDTSLKHVKEQVQHLGAKIDTLIEQNQNSKRLRRRSGSSCDIGRCESLLRLDDERANESMKMLQIIAEEERRPTTRWAL